MNPEELILRVTDLARGGAGVSRDPSGRVIFIPHTAPGDLVRARVVESDKRYAQAVLLEVLEPAPIRQTPPCPVFGQCGGCQWQHLPYSLQWDTKVKGVIHALSRVQITVPESVESLPADRIWEYRNRIQLRGKDGILGFYKAGSNEMVPVDGCKIARPEINQVWKETQKESQQFKRPFKVEVEVLPDGEVRKTWNSRHAASGFRQIHDEQNEKLRQWVVQTLKGSDVLFDLFGGAGNLSVPLASAMKEIHCVDVTAPRSHPSDVPGNLHFHRAPVAVWLLKYLAQGSHGQGKSSSAILDPPREGLGKEFSEIASALESLGVREVVAVGCDPDSWARDVSKWIKRGWKLKKVMAVDLFPQTPHIEAVALLAL